MASSAVLGGTLSEIGGGKFANGAVTGPYSMLFNEVMHQVQEQKQKNLEKQLEEKLKDLQVGESISGKELGQLSGHSEVSKFISKITRTGEASFSVNRTIGGRLIVKDSPMSIEKTTLMIGNRSELVYRIIINYKSTPVTKLLLSDFYINNNDIFFYEKGKLLRGSK